MLTEQVGLVKTGTVVSVNPSKNTMDVSVDGFSVGGVTNNITVSIPQPFMNSKNISAVGLPSTGTTVIVAQGLGGQYHCIGFYSRNFDNTNIDDESFTISSNNNTFFKVKKNNIVLGENKKNITIQTNVNNSFYNSYFDSFSEFSEGTRFVSGAVKRDLTQNSNIPDSLKLQNPSYDDFLKPIGFDNTLASNKFKNTTTKNPAFIESRYLVTEFPENSNVLDDLTESNNYGTESVPNKKYKSSNRRLNKTDVLGLSLTHPNYLIESIQGTVIDIFGNVLDINRYPLPIGQGKFTIKSEEDAKTDSKKDKYINLRSLHRRGLAYHFEINARKDFVVDGELKVPNINDNYDYSRARSRFFMDIDKEGQFKLNVPASSESGNIPLLTRYENFSYLSPDDDSNPNKFIKREDNLDILHDSFTADSYDIFKDEKNRIKGGIDIEYLDNKTNIVDRITSNVIKHGTTFHDITSTLYSFKKSDFLDYQYFPDNIIDTSKLMYTTTDFVSKKITVGKNAGGRSGQMNFDGSLEFNIGANTVDRQSVWIDTAGGIVANIGRDKNMNSAVVSLDGDMLVQIGGYGISSDGRFTQLNNAFRGGVLDIRVLTSGLRETVIRIDDTGVTMMTPGSTKVYSAGDLQVQCDGTASFKSEEMFIQDRLVQRGSDFGTI